MTDPRTDRRRVADLQVHPMSLQVFGHLEPDEFDDLKADIAKRGLRHMIEVDSFGRVICGGERTRALQELGIPTITVVIHDELVRHEDIEEYLILDNLRRRHLKPSQRYRAGKELERIESIRVQERGRSGVATLIPSHPNDRKTDAIVGKAIGTNRATYQRLKTVFEKGSSAIQEAVDRGDLSISGAAAKVLKARPRAGRVTKLPGDDPRVHSLRWARLQAEARGLRKFLHAHPLGDFGAHAPHARKFLEALQGEVRDYLLRVHDRDPAPGHE